MSFYDDDALENQPEHATSLNETVGRNVQRLRVEQSLPKKTFAHIANVSRPQLDKIESGEADVRLSCIARIADSLSVAPADLLKPHQ